MGSKKLYFLLVLIILVSSVSAIDYYKYNTVIDYKKPCFNNLTYCSGTATCNITVFDPENSVVINNQLMTNKVAYFNYSISNRTILGEYRADIVCFDAGFKGANSFFFEVTGNGKSNPGTGIIILFIVLFVVIGISLIYLAIHSVGHFLTLDTDIIDVAFNMAGYIGLLAAYVMHDFYVGNPKIEEILVWVLGITGFTNVLVPLIAFFVSIIWQSMKRKKPWLGGQI